MRTRRGFLDLVKDQVHELVVAFQCTDDCALSVF
jgi:hypothetical protein